MSKSTEQGTERTWSKPKLSFYGSAEVITAGNQKDLNQNDGFSNVIAISC